MIPKGFISAGIFHFMTTKKSTKKVAAKKSVKATKKAPKKAAKALAAKKAAEPAKILSVDNGESNVSVSTTKPTFDSLTDLEHSITPVQAEKIAEERQSHEDERPPNSELSIPELASRAWDEVRDIDPPLSDCVQSHVEKYLHHAQVILKGSPPLGGSTRLAQFEQAVNRLMKK